MNNHLNTHIETQGPVPRVGSLENVDPPLKPPNHIKPLAGLQVPANPTSELPANINPPGTLPGNAIVELPKPAILPFDPCESVVKLVDLPVTAKDIIESLYGPDEIVGLRIINDTKEGNFRAAKLSFPCAQYTNYEEILKQHNAKGRCISFVVNSGGHDNASIIRIKAQFFELDDGSFEEQLAKINAFPIKPSLVIKTRKSLHVYYFLDSSALVERYRPIQKRLVALFGGDPACVDEARAMRLPGFMHCKQDPPVKVTCICFHPERKYTQDQLAAALPALDPAPVKHQYGTQSGINLVAKTCEFIQYCRDNASTLSEPLWYAMITVLAPFRGGTKMIQDLSSPYPDYSEDETLNKIDHFLSSGTNPMTCSTICEKGFRCPKRDSGECSAKSPAALCFIPLQLANLIDILHSIPATCDMSKNVDAAKQFVLDFLYNADVVTADYMIETAIPDHFNLKTSTVKSLKAVLKEERSKYQSSKATKRANADPSLPEWYIPTGKGLHFLPGILAKAMSNKMPMFFAAQQYYCYQDGVYVQTTEMQIQALLKEMMLPEETKFGDIYDTERQLRLLSLKNVRELNPNPYIINVRNGLYDVLEDTLNSHTPTYLSTVQLNVQYDKEADCPQFKEFLDFAMDGDMEQVALIQEMMGYLLIPVNSAQVSFLIVGAAGAGKSLLLRVISDLLLGSQNVSHVPWQALNERFQLAELFGKLANIFADLPTKAIEDNGIFKALVGEDYVTAERKNKDPFPFLSTARLLFSCNSIPRNLGDRSEGFYRRLIIIRFNSVVPENMRDPKLLNKFRMEADGILQFALEGLQRLIKNEFKFSVTQINAEELQRYREDSDSMLSFVREYCEFGAEYSVGSTELWQAYRNYCQDCGLKPYAQKQFVSKIRDTYPGVDRGIDRMASRRTLKGIKMINP